MPVSRENLFGEEFRHESPRFVTALMRPSNRGKGIVLTTQVEGREEIVDDETARALERMLFPPRPLMTDGITERSTMYQAAATARGRVLVGGLGLAIYPQLVCHLRRPVTEIVIVENDQRVIDLIGKPWLDQLPQSDVAIRIEADTIESYLACTREPFDTVYLDLWGDAHARFLPYINHLVRLAEPRLASGGEVRCWLYGFMVEDFVKLAVFLEEKQHFDNLEDIDLLNCYMSWRKARQNPSLQEVRAAAFRYATTLANGEEIKLSIDLDWRGKPYPG